MSDCGIRASELILDLHTDLRKDLLTKLDEVTEQMCRYREALQEIVCIEDEQFGGDWDEIEKAREIARKALWRDE